jgi:diacylglycerol kinase family enzyme
MMAALSGDPSPPTPLRGTGSGPEVAPERWLAIVNPASGAMQSRAFRRRWFPLIERAVGAIAFSRRPGEATQLAATFGDYDGVAAVGGDGTVFEVLSGIDRARQRFAILPTGRGNSLARDLGIAGMRQALDALEGGQARPVDLIDTELQRADGRKMRVVAGSTVAVGYAVSVAQRSAAFKAAGKQAYAIAAGLVRPAAFHIRIGYHGAAPVPCERTGLIINNTRHIANFLAFPGADSGDGLIEAMELRAGWFRQTLHSVGVLAGHSILEPWRRVQTTAISIDLQMPAPVLVDGEIFGRVVAIRTTCLPAGVLCQVPVTS